MIQCGTHDDYKDPPHVPMITGMPQKCLKKDSLAETFAGAAEAIAKAFSTPQNRPAASSSRPDSGIVGVSPGKCTYLRSKNLQQLRFLQELLRTTLSRPLNLLNKRLLFLMLYVTLHNILLSFMYMYRYYVTVVKINVFVMIHSCKYNVM